ncbi:TIGR03936 family radical SAM-associated protein [Nocardioides sp.]|uniref:TIGR03936 family radical SAM-associated protein n=1 Tax=Nocardioides sp. TaxID=35761 RepID=UPI003529A7A0
MSRPQPEQQAPPVQRLRLRYAKRGRLRFASHRDFSRAFERALVRARLPMAYSSGFNPHPRISYAGAAPTGAASEAEYLEIGLAERVDPAEALDRLRAVLPDGFDPLLVVESPGGALADRLQASRWRVELGVDADAGRRAVEAFLAAPEVQVSRMTKKGIREFDARGAVLRLVEAGPADEPADDAPGRGEGLILEVWLRHQEPAVRPDDVLSGLRRVGDLPDSAPPRLTRLEQGTWDDATGSIGDPLG